MMIDDELMNTSASEGCNNGWIKKNYLKREINGIFGEVLGPWFSNFLADKQISQTPIQSHREHAD